MGRAFATIPQELLARLRTGNAGAGEVVLSDEYWEVSKRITRVGMLASLLIVVAVFLMVVEPLRWPGPGHSGAG